MGIKCKGKKYSRALNGKKKKKCWYSAVCVCCVEMCRLHIEVSVKPRYIQILASLHRITKQKQTSTGQQIIIITVISIIHVWIYVSMYLTHTDNKIRTRYPSNQQRYSVTTADRWWSCNALDSQLRDIGFESCWKCFQTYTCLTLLLSMHVCIYVCVICM